MTKEDLLAMGKDELCDRATFDDIFSEPDAFDTAELLGAATDRAAELKIKTRFGELLKAYKKQLRGYMAEPGNRYSYKGMEYDCGGWTIKDSGVTALTDKGTMFACYHPILPIKRLKNLQTKKEKMTIAFKRGVAWDEITMDKEVVASNSRIVKLAGFGVSVTTENAKPLVQFLADVENRNEIPLENSTSKFGWTEPKSVLCGFVPFDSEVVFDAESLFRSLSDSLDQNGTRDCWMAEALGARARTGLHPEPQLMMAASLASVLVGPMNMSPFIVNVYGETGKGKTVALMMAASVWADPSEGRYMTDALSTQNAFEAREDILNSLPLMIDDFSKVRDRFEDGFSDLVYLLASGRGKERSNVDLGLNPTKTWRNITVSNMERPLAENIRKGGGRNRVLDFEMGDGAIFEDGNRTVTALKGNYGFAGPEFVEACRRAGLTALRDERWEIQREIMDEAERQGRRIEEKQVMGLSLILLGDRLAEREIFRDGRLLDLAWCVSQLRSVEEVSENKRAYDTLMDVVNENIKKFDPPANYSGEVWGSMSGGYVHINPRRYEEIARQNNFSKTMLLRWADDNGLLKHTQGKLQNVVGIPGTRSTARAYSFLMQDGDPDEEGFSPAGDDDLPFE